MFIVNIVLGIFILEALISLESIFLSRSWCDALIPITVVLIFSVLLFFVHSVVLTFVLILLSVFHSIYATTLLIDFGEAMEKTQRALEEMQVTTKEEYEALERQRKEAEIVNSNGIKAGAGKVFGYFFLFLAAILTTVVFGLICFFERPETLSLEAV